MHLRSRRGGGLLSPEPVQLQPQIARRSQRLRHVVTPPEEKIKQSIKLKGSLRKKGNPTPSKPRSEASPHDRGRPGLSRIISTTTSDSNFRTKRKNPGEHLAIGKLMKQNVNPSSLDCHLKIPTRSQFHDLFSNFFNKCFQCDEEYLCHIRLKILNSEQDNFKSEQFIQQVANESVDFVTERSRLGACSHNLSLDSGSINQSDGCLESLVKVEILEGDSMELKPFDVKEQSASPTTPTCFFSSNCQTLDTSSVSDTGIGDVEVIGLGQAVGTTITFNFIPSGEKSPDSQEVPGQGTTRIIKRRPGGRQIPTAPSIIPTMINGVNIADFKAKLDNLRMCGICRYPANGMVDLNMHQLVAHSLAKGKNGGRRGPEWSAAQQSL